MPKNLITADRYEAVLLDMDGVITDDPPSAETVCGLGNRKNELVDQYLASAGAEAFPGSVAFIKYLRKVGIKTAVVTSSQNCQAVLRAAKIEDLFDARVDGHVLLQYSLAGKPAPDCYLKAAEMLGVRPRRAVVIEARFPASEQAQQASSGS
jgi:beta-phosphoglucomutase-like phosphatase (HAD superfamily)